MVNAINIGRRSFIASGASFIAGCAGVFNPGFAEKDFAKTDLGMMIAKGINDELDIHSQGEATREEARDAKADVERWLAHMKENGYVEDYKILVLPYVENNRGLLFFSRVRIKARGYSAAVFDHIVISSKNKAG